MSAFGTICTLIAEVLLLFCGAFFASSETAYTSLSRITVRQMVKDGEKNSRLIQRLRENLDRLISTVLIGTNLVTTLMSALATKLSVNVFGAEYVSYGTAVVSIMVIIFSEIIPKTYAAARPRQVAEHSAKPIAVLQKVAFPVVFMFDQLTRFVSFVEHKLLRKKRPLITEEELKVLLDVGKNEGTLEEDEKKMLERLFEFSDLKVEDISRHRSLVRYVNVTDSLEEVIAAFAESGYSRLPVCEESPESVVGVLHYKAVLFASRAICQSKDFVRICMSPVDFVPQSIAVLELLQRFKKNRENFAVVINEYGETAGIVTMDDILREVLGRITDEYGGVELSPEKRVTVVSANEFIVPGDMKLDDLNDVLKLELDSENFDTLGGWLLERFDELPSIGALYKYAGALFIVEDQSARRIQSVRIRLGV